MNNDVIKICEKDSVHQPYITELKLMNVSDPRSLFFCATQEVASPDLCNAGSMLHQLCYQADWELVYTVCIYFVRYYVSHELYLDVYISCCSKLQ